MEEYIKKSEARHAVLHNEGQAVIAAIDNLKTFEPHGIMREMLIDEMIDRENRPQTNAELIKALRYCGNSRKTGCKGCPLWDKPMDACFQIVTAAADALEAAEQRIAELEKELEIWTARSFEGKIGSMALTNLNLKKEIYELEAQMPKEGEWTTKRTWYHDGEIYCSVCDHDAPTEGDYRQVKTNYCPNCGARMKKGANDKLD